ncbi:hypothetical protein CK203_067347 [Vitis vinifera]|uniref:Uncharacterized protein n=1 Tax=Vitis vinifera TaxID=29760 RepID=A0A438EFP3_VITVI|nr:hypothetical protein CK203_067347 [Vitis vinifera]
MGGPFPTQETSWWRQQVKMAGHAGGQRKGKEESWLERGQKKEKTEEQEGKIRELHRGGVLSAVAHSLHGYHTAGMTPEMPTFTRTTSNATVYTASSTPFDDGIISGEEPWVLAVKDIKTTDISLDENRVAKFADFGVVLFEVLCAGLAVEESLMKERSLRARRRRRCNVMQKVDGKGSEISMGVFAFYMVLDALSENG